jgi:glycosyltransferase involved in cell wall biosynthesis
MPENISKRILLVVSDTPVYREGRHYTAFEPVVRELEFVANLFDEIIWLGCNTKSRKHAMRVPTAGKSINITAMPSVTNRRLNFLYVLVSYPLFLFYIMKYMRRATHIHTRGPSHPALISLFLSPFYASKSYWHKYAGNWVASNTAFSYSLQRRLLKNKKSRNKKVSVNGTWLGNPAHIISLENPCMSENERIAAKETLNNKDYSQSLNLLFVGNLTAAKGILELLDAVSDEKFPKRIHNIFIAGDGDLKEIVLQRAKKMQHCNVEVVGFLNRSEINTLYEKSHLLILPSKSEGFPKVIAEAASYGCIPIATDVSAISQYIDDGVNGFLLKDNKPATILKILDAIVKIEHLDVIGKKGVDMCRLFTYEHYTERIKNEIFKN